MASRAYQSAMGQSSQTLYQIKLPKSVWYSLGPKLSIRLYRESLALSQQSGLPLEVVTSYVLGRLAQDMNSAAISN